jgi:hypothetical protein
MDLELDRGQPLANVFRFDVKGNSPEGYRLVNLQNLLIVIQLLDLA